MRPTSNSAEFHLLPRMVAVIALILGLGAHPHAATPAGPKAKADSSAKATAKPKKASHTPATIDKRTVQDLYQSGEFDQLIALLENMRRERRLRDRDDSIFIYKYLGVVYGADMTTRRKAESFLYQMLKLDPRQDLEDLEVGDAILTMFREVRKRYDRTAHDTLSAAEAEHVRSSLKTYGYPIDSTGKNLVNVTPDSANAANQSAASGTSSATPQTGARSAATSSGGFGERQWLWVAGGAAAVTLIGVGAILLMSEPEPKSRTIVTEVK